MNYKEAMQKLKSNKIEKLYLLYGEEIYLAEGFIRYIKKQIVSPGFETLNFHVMDAKDFTMEKFIDACETLPFMAEKKLVLIQNLEVFQSKKKSMTEEEEKSIIAYLEKIPETTCLIFYGSTTIDARKKIVKEIQKHGNLIDFQKLNPKELKEWIEKRIEKAGKKTTRKEIEFFMENIDYVGKNASQSLLDIENEIKKITAYIGEKEVLELHDLENIFTSNFQNDIFKLMNDIEKKQPKEAMKRLNLMLHQGEPIMKIAATLGNHVRNLYKTKLLLEEGYSSKMIASKLSIHPFVAGKCANQCRQFTMIDLEKLLNQFLAMDLAIKSGKMKDSIALELFIMEMCK
ncbi:DNA polymerase III, delta subunit [Natronincola peptidivorans]|uniref:DNA polymerase III subunit delta n=1 Tax=Natronincola peptidivorans TaxID=426128 RepID=A0A1I0EA22_9FIRM|nr:DNA polymerase III subunit delta [Natronincola peptidivorans]SET41957.1 DNA polymerase III, delta subunit [Natronincola peptidivorans]